MTSLETVPTTQTLAERMATGKIPVPEALRYSMILADALRKIHDSGHAHGAVSPSSIVLGRTVELLPADAHPGAVTPYTAPELLDGKPADARSDIFSFGAIFFEMLTGRPAFQGGDESSLTDSIRHTNPPATGSPAVDRLVGNCVAKNPDARWSRAQKLLLELKLLSVAVKRTESTAPSRQQIESAMRSEIQLIEKRLANRLEQCEQGIAAVNSHLAHIEVLQQATAERADRLEHAIETARQETTARQDALYAELNGVDRSVKAQSAAIESLRTAMSQTDDLVERVVEALESLQAVVLEHSEEKALAAH